MYLMLYRAPKVDKYMVDFIGKCLPRGVDLDLTKIQSLVLAAMHPLTSA